MLAVLVLSAITAVAFSLATIVFIEIRSAGDASRTEPAVYATFGVTEEALFQYKRFTSVDSIPDFDVASCTGPRNSNVCRLNGVTMTLPGTQPIAFDTSPRVEFVAANSTKVLPMYLVDRFDQIFESITIETFPNPESQPIRYHFVITPSTNIPEVTGAVTANPGEVHTPRIDDLGQYELVLENTSRNQDVAVKISTVRLNGEKPSGLPYIGEQVLRIKADYLGLTRTYQVRIPIP